MKLRELMEYMERIAPKDLAAEWDNVGLMCGDPDNEIHTVVVALDADRKAIEFAVKNGADVIVSHHPVIFSPVRAVTAPAPLYMLLSNGVASFAAHTNLDVAQNGVNDTLAETIGLRHTQAVCDGFARVGNLPEPMSPKSFADYVGKTLGTSVQVRQGDRPVKTVAVVGGSGGDFIGDVEADAFVTGEIKHHEWLAAPNGMTVICAGHYATEAVIVEPLSEAIRSAFPMLRVLAFRSEAPYETV